MKKSPDIRRFFVLTTVYTLKIPEPLVLKLLLPD